MAISRIKTSSVLQGFPKSRSLLAGNTAFMPGNYDSIASVTVGSGGSATVEFTSIPATYTHLQIRFIGSSTRSFGANDFLMQINSDTGSNYSNHFLAGYGTGTQSAGAANVAGTYNRILPNAIPSADNAGIFGAGVIDILDYANTNKYKTIRVLGGNDVNGATYGGWIALGSSSWRNTNAITSLYFTPETFNWAQYTQFALYGIKAGA